MCADILWNILRYFTELEMCKLNDGKLTSCEIPLRVSPELFII